MEVSYLIFAVNPQNPQEFIEELHNKFPFSVIKFLSLNNRKLLVLFNNINFLLKYRICCEQKAYQMEDTVMEFARKYPYLKLMYVYFLGNQSVGYYEGFVLKNKTKLAEAGGLNDSYKVLLKQIIPFQGNYFEAFTPEFIEMTIKHMDKRIKVVQGDITKLEVDVIVNAANPKLIPGGGVDGAIHQAAGRQVYLDALRLLKDIKSLPTGYVMPTIAGNLNAKAIFHAVGPLWQSGDFNEVQLLQQCYYRALELACAKGYKTIAFPNISTGVYGFPKQLACEIAMDTVKRFLDQYQCIEQVIFVCYDFQNYALYKDLINH
ncbi:macro domain-containing protein [Myroides sp. LJL119]